MIPPPSDNAMVTRKLQIAPPSPLALRPADPNFSVMTAAIYTY
jgi:hypothetical protein